MVAYQPARKPLARRILGSTIFQLFALALVIAVVFSYAREQRRQELAERIAEIESAHSTQTFSRHAANDQAPSRKRQLASNPPDAPAAEDHASQNQKHAEETHDADAAASPSETKRERAANDQNHGTSAALLDTPASDDSTSAKSPTGAETETSSLAGATNARVSFAAVSRLALNDLIASADPNNTVAIGPVTVGVLARAPQKLRALQSTEYWEMLDSSSRALNSDQPAEFYGGQRDMNSGQFIGFLVEITPSSLGSTEAVMHLRVWRYLRESAGIDVFSVPLPETITIPKGGAAFITGALFSKRVNSAEERRFYAPLKVMHILASEPYRNNLTDLLIVIEPR